MDIVKIGKFLARLRRERGWNQEQLGEKLGVTNKTVSRWENGNYLPTVEMLQLLSNLYGISINEILSGERLAAEDYREKAEENIKATLEISAFTLKEKIDFFKKKWIREHLAMAILEFSLLLILLVISHWQGQTLWGTAVYVLGVLRLLGYRNQMMAYVEDRAFDGSGSR